MKNDNHSSVLVPYYLPLENIKTIGNFIGIPVYKIPPYCLTVPTEKVSEINLEKPDDKLYYMDFNYEK